MSSPFATHHRWDRAYHLLWLTLAWAAILVGFGPRFLSRVDGRLPPDPLIVEIHAAVFFGWLVLVSLQIGLIRWKRIKTHVRLGQLSVALGAAVVVVGVATAATMSRAAFDKTQDPGTLQFFFHQLMDMSVFGSFLTAGLLLRKSAAAHKRLMVLATTFLLGAGFSRAIGPWLASWLAPLPDHQSVGSQFFAHFLILYGGINVLLAMAAAYDLITRRRLHPANAWGIPIVLACEILSACIVVLVPSWSSLAEWLLY